MDDVEAVAVHLAERIAPDEVDLAPLLARVLVEKGPEAEELQATGEASLLGGCFEGSTIALCWGVLTSLMACVGFMVDVLDLSQQKERFIERVRLLLAGGAEAADDHVADRVRRAVNALAAELHQSGLEADRARDVSRETLFALLDMPEKSRNFLLKLRQEA